MKDKGVHRVLYFPLSASEQPVVKALERGLRGRDSSIKYLLTDFYSVTLILPACVHQW